MDRKMLIKEITKWQEQLVKLASAKKYRFSDPEVYQCSCIIDRLIIEYMKDNKKIYCRKPSN